MKMKLIGLLSVLIAGIVLEGNWHADAPNAKVAFTVKGPFGTVHGNFTDLKATIQFNEKDLAGSSVVASIGAATVSTGIGLRNRDLRKKEEWLNTDKFPLVSFRSKKIQRTSTGFSATGDLTLKGITKPIDISFTFSGTGNEGMFKGQFTINRQDYTIGKPGGSVGETITLTLEVPVKK